MSVQAVKTKPILIGLTGGIGSGKTTASNYFQSLGIPVIDSDLIVKRLWKENMEMVQKIEKSFGFPIKNDLDRKKLAKIICFVWFLFISSSSSFFLLHGLK